MVTAGQLSVGAEKWSDSGHSANTFLTDVSMRIWGMKGKEMKLTEVLGPDPKMVAPFTKRENAEGLKPPRIVEKSVKFFPGAKIHSLCTFLLCVCVFGKTCIYPKNQDSRPLFSPDSL